MHMAQKVILWWKERCLLAMLVNDTQNVNSQTSLRRTATLTRDTAVFLLRSLPGNLVDDVGDGVYSQAFVDCPGSQALWYGLSLRIGQFTFFRSRAVPLPHHLLNLHRCQRPMIKYRLAHAQTAQSFPRLNIGIMKHLQPQGLYLLFKAEPKRS